MAVCGYSKHEGDRFIRSTDEIIVRLDLRIQGGRSRLKGGNPTLGTICRGCADDIVARFTQKESTISLLDAIDEGTLGVGGR